MLFLLNYGFRGRSEGFLFFVLVTIFFLIIEEKILFIMSLYFKGKIGYKMKELIMSL